MGGCELARYVSRHNGARVGKVVFVSDVTPYLQKTEDNPLGKDKAIFTNMIERVERATGHCISRSFSKPTMPSVHPSR